MRYKIIKGEFHIFYPDLPKNGPEPDGDTITFKPDNPQHVTDLWKPGTPPPGFNRRGMLPLRLESIDTLETHFLDMHQQLDLANGARNMLLKRLGFRNVMFWPDQPNKIQAVRNNPQRGYVIASGFDGHGRLLSFVYAGEHPLADGSSIFLDAPLLNKSVNAYLVANGLAYAELYTTLPVDLSRHVATLTKRARRLLKGLWRFEDVGLDKAASIPDLATLESLVLWPKLFRRLASYFAEGNMGLENFEVWLRDDTTNRDDRVLLPNRELGNMHDLIALGANDTIKMTFNTEDVIILPDNA